MQAAIILVLAVHGAIAVRQEDASKAIMDADQEWGEKVAGSYCCYNVDAESRGRFTATSKGYVNTDDIEKCDITADKACPIEGESLTKNPDGTDALFLDQAKIWDAITGKIDNQLLKDDLEKQKAALYQHVKKHVGAYEAFATQKIEDDYKAQVGDRYRAAEQVFQDEKTRIETKYSTSSSEFTQKNQEDVHNAVSEVRATLDSKTEDAETTNAQNTAKAQAEAADAIRAAQEKLTEDMRQAEEVADHAIQEATDVYNQATSTLTAEQSAALAEFIKAEQQKLENETEAALGTRTQAFEQVVAEEKEARDLKRAPIADIVAHTTGNWSVSADIEALYDARKDKCGGGDKCCCLGTLGEDSRTYQAYKVPKNFAFSTCKDTAPYTGGVFGFGSCKYFRHCNSCIKKLCNAEGHCGSAPLA